MTNQEVLYRFFREDKELSNLIKLTEKEIYNFDMFEYRVLCANALKNINGGWSKVTIYDGDEEDIYCDVSCGDLENKTTWDVKYNRQTETFS